MIESSNITNVAKITGGRLIGPPQLPVEFIATDSRTLNGTAQVLFIAITGSHHNGNDYIEEVYKKGVRCFICDQEQEKYFPDAAYCIVDDSLEALHDLAREKRRMYSGQLLAVTGSNGKTIVKEWLYQILQLSSFVIRSPRSYNSQLGVPLSLWQLDSEYQFGIIEAGISQPGEMEKLRAIIEPDIGILTNIGSAHAENFTSNTQKLFEKIELFKGVKKLIYCEDQQVDKVSIGDFLHDLHCEKISWSTRGNGKYNFFLEEEKGMQIHVKLSHEQYSIRFLLPFNDKSSVENLLNVITALLELKVDADIIQQGLNHLEMVEMRLETLDGIHNSRLVNDVYNSDLAGLSTALDVLVQQKKQKRKIVILSELFQSGIKEEELYQLVADILAFREIEKTILVGEAVIRQKHLFPENTLYYQSTEDFLNRFNPWEIEDAAVLIKGARNFRFERITQLLGRQVHRTVLEININELIYNLNYYRSLLSPQTKVMVMVKALSYGSGSDEIAGYLQHEQVDYLAVAFPDEGVRLRESRIDLPIMVMNTDPRDYKVLFEHQLEPEIFTREGLMKFIEQCKFFGRERYPFHLKLDTGMHRLGFVESDLDWLCNILQKEEVALKSIFTHLAASEDPKQDRFSKEQVESFLNMSERIEETLGEKVLKHVLNSAGVERFPDYHFDMVRIGIGLYGYGLSDELVAVSSFKSAISQVKFLKAGQTVGYGRMGKLSDDALIATIPVGYADGIDRKLGNGNYSFYLKGRFVPTVGNICMDMTMLDITGVDADIGDAVEIFGNNLPITGMADKLETIVYEVLTSIPERVKRVYIRE